MTMWTCGMVWIRLWNGIGLCFACGLMDFLMDYVIMMDFIMDYVVMMDFCEL
jgi:hypothetical protein